MEDRDKGICWWALIAMRVSPVGDARAEDCGVVVLLVVRPGHTSLPPSVHARSSLCRAGSPEGGLVYGPV